MPKNKVRKQNLGHNKRIEKKIAAVQRLNPFVSQYIKKLEDENERMKTDPDTAIGQLVPQMRQAISQNKRLSVLAAAFIETQGGSVKLSKSALEAFETKVLSINWTLPEGVEKIEEADEFIFTFTAQSQEEAISETPQATIEPIEEEPIASTEVEEPLAVIGFDRKEAVEAEVEPIS